MQRLTLAHCSRANWKQMSLQGDATQRAPVLSHNKQAPPGSSIYCNPTSREGPYLALFKLENEFVLLVLFVVSKFVRVILHKLLYHVGWVPLLL